MQVTPARTRAVRLTCHPTTRDRRVRSIEVQVQRTPEGSLAFSFCLTGDVARLRIPDARMATRGDGLWRHTCFEAFVAARQGSAYCEFNFSPSGKWAAYRFSSYRRGGPLDEATDPRITLRTGPDRLELDALVTAVALPAERGASLRLALSAVIEDDDGGLCYWAFRHPPGEPDFHHRDGFAVELDAQAENDPVKVEKQ